MYITDQNYQLMFKYSALLRELAYKLSEAINLNLEYERHEINVPQEIDNAETLLKEIQSHSNVLNHIFLTLRQQAIQIEAHEMLTPEIITEINEQKSKAGSDPRKLQLAISSTLYNNVNEIEGIVQKGEAFCEIYDDFLYKLKEIGNP